MTIKYTGASKSLLTTNQIIATMEANSKSATVVHLQATNRDAVYRRTLRFWIGIQGSAPGNRNIGLLDAVEVPFGTPVQLSGITLNPGESLNGYADTDSLLMITTSTGEQQ